jgi:hypothetical protein
MTDDINIKQEFKKKAALIKLLSFPNPYSSEE